MTYICRVVKQCLKTVELKDLKHQGCNFLINCKVDHTIMAGVITQAK